MIVEIPIRVYNALNEREHWAKRARRAKQERFLAKSMLPSNIPSLPVVITLTRVGKRRMDGDGLQASLKHIRDGVADKYGVDDADSRMEWRYEQRTGKEYCVEIKINT